MKCLSDNVNVSTTKQNYRLLIVSPVPVSSANGKLFSLDLWVEDLKENLNVVESITVLAPRALGALESAQSMPEAIKVVYLDQIVNRADIQQLIHQVDVVSIGAGAPFWRIKTAFAIAQEATINKKCLITAITSDRAQTTIMNAVGKHWLKKMKAKITAWGINKATLKLATFSSGVVVIGVSVLESIQLKHANVYIETASWIHQQAIISDTALEHKLTQIKASSIPKAIIATRLEPMKGIHMGIEALAQIRQQADITPTLSILGKGAALDDLKALVAQHELQAQVTFDGVRAYPEAFFAEIGRFELMLLTNLNVELPRLIFDAISQGLVPICPDFASYLNLKLPQQVYYKKGDVQSLMQTWLNLSNIEVLEATLRVLRPLAYEYTIESMHQKRAGWVANALASNK